MHVPIVPNTTVVNKTIVYSDMVVSRNNFGNNVQICSVRNIDEEHIESCLKKVFEMNPGVTFDTIQYSRSKRKIYLYTDKQLKIPSLSEIEDGNLELVDDDSKILEEIQSILTSDENIDPDCISLYDVAALVRKYEESYKYIIKQYSEICSIKMSGLIYNPTVLISDLIYDKQQLTVELQTWFRDPERIVFSKRNGKLYIIKSDSSHDEKVLHAIGNDLLELFDELLRFSDFKTKNYADIKLMNTRLLADINHHGVNLHFNSDEKPYKELFGLSLSSYKFNDYNLKCSSELISSELTGLESELFKKVFVRIEDCPEWSQKDLYRIRQEQLEQEGIKECIYHNIVEIKQKGHQLVRKILPWV